MRAGLAGAVRDSAPELNEQSTDAVVESVIAFLSTAAVLNQLAEIVHESLLTSAHVAAEFGGLDGQRFWDSRDCSEIAVMTVRDVIAEVETNVATLDDAPRLHHLLTQVAYRDWKFSLTQLGGRPAVLASASVPNVYDAQRTFSTSRSAIIADDPLEAIYRVVLQLEEHEARERLRVGDDRPLNPHGSDSTMPAVPVADFPNHVARQ